MLMKYFFHWHFVTVSRNCGVYPFPALTNVAFGGIIILLYCKCRKPIPYRKGKMNIMGHFVTNITFCATQQASGAQDFLTNYGFLIIMIVAIVVMLVFSSRSNKKRQKQYQDMLNEIKPGSRVRTIGGIYGTVTKVQDDVVIVSVGPDKARLVFAKQAIASIEDAPVEATIDGEILSSEKK